MALSKSLNSNEIAKLVYGNTSAKKWTVESLKRDLNNKLQNTGYFIQTDNGLSDMNIYKIGNKFYTYLGGDVKGQSPMVAEITDKDTLNYLKSNPSVSQATAIGSLNSSGYKFNKAPTIVDQFTRSNGQTVTTYSDGNIVITNPTTNNTNTNNTNKNTETVSSGSGGGYNPYAGVIQQQNNTIKDLQAKLDEANRVYTGEELADHYGIRDTLFSRDYWNKLYTDYVNEMYDDLINQQNEYRNRFTRNNSTYDDYLEKEYVNSYNNASNARTTRGAVAANALSTGNVNDYNSSKNDTSMLQNIYGYEALRQAGLADVANKAEQAANNNRAVLMQLGAKHNTSDVTAATNRLNAAATIYNADKNYLSGLAAAANTKYGGLVNAASANANSQFQQYYDWYMQMYNNNKDLASTYLTNTLGVDSKAGV